MSRINVSDQMVEDVVGGSIVFSADKKTCGLNCTDQFAVNDLTAIIQYIDKNKATMTEREMLKAMMGLGLITRL